MNKRLLIIITSIVIILAVAVLIAVNYLYNRENKKDYRIVINYNNSAEAEETKQILIESKEEIKTLKNYLKIISSSEKADVRLALLNEVIIDFGNDETVIIQTSVEKYCYYKNGDTTKLVEMPVGFLEYVKKYL